MQLLSLAEGERGGGDFECWRSALRRPREWLLMVSKSSVAVQQKAFSSLFR